MQFAELNSKEIVRTLIDELSRFSPRELLVSPACSANEELQAFIRGRLECVQNFVAEEDYQDETLEQLVVQQFQSSRWKNSNRKDGNWHCGQSAACCPI